MSHGQAEERTEQNRWMISLALDGTGNRHLALRTWRGASEVGGACMRPRRTWRCRPYPDCACDAWTPRSQQFGSVCGTYVQFLRARISLSDQVKHHTLGAQHVQRAPPAEVPSSWPNKSPNWASVGKNVYFPVRLRGKPSKERTQKKC